MNLFKLKWEKKIYIFGKFRDFKVFLLNITCNEWNCKHQTNSKPQSIWLTNNKFHCICNVIIYRFCNYGLNNIRIFRTERKNEIKWTFWIPTTNWKSYRLAPIMLLQIPKTQKVINFSKVMGKSGLNNFQSRFISFFVNFP